MVPLCTNMRFLLGCSVVIQWASAQLRSTSSPAPIRSIFVQSPFVYVASSDKSIYQYQLSDLQRASIFTHPSSNPSSIVVSKLYLIAGFDNGDVYQWDLQGPLINSFNPHSSAVSRVQISPYDKDQLLSCSTDSKVATLSLKQKTAVSSWNPHGTSQITDCAYYNNTHVLTSSTDARIAVSSNSGLAHFLLGHTTSICRMIAYEEFVITSSSDSTRKWRISTGQELERSFVSGCPAMAKSDGYLFTARSIMNESSLIVLSNLSSFIAIDTAADVYLTGSSDRQLSVWQFSGLSKSLPTWPIDSDPRAPTSTSAPSGQPPEVVGLPAITVTTIVIIVASFAGTIAVLRVAWALLKRCKKEQTAVDKMRAEVANAMTNLDFTHLSAAQATNTATDNTVASKSTTGLFETFQGTTTELGTGMSDEGGSLPPWLELNFGVDFLNGDQIGKGTDCVLYTCVPIATNLQMSSQGHQLMNRLQSLDVKHMTREKQSEFLREIEIMWRYRNNQYFCKLYGFSGSPACIITEYYGIGHLKSYIYKKRKIKNAPYTVLQVIELLRQICQGLYALHQCSLAHCDLKPSNIMLQQQGDKLQIVLSDFAYTRNIDFQGDAAGGQQARTPLQRDLRGSSLLYAAPEIITVIRSNKNPPNPFYYMSGDLYALGIMYLEVFTRRTPWKQ
jgi:hypothetical protein